jgi:predicted transport protein
MGDIKLFHTNNGDVTELQGHSVTLEKSLQSLIESNLETFLGIQFLASEYSTGKKHGGRIDTLGIDENGCPCIIEYKRKSNENVINQGLYYLDWLMDHCGEFELLIMNKLGEERSKLIEWDNPRLICIAGDFNKFDAHAVSQINRNIELMRYVRYGEDFLILDLLNAVTQVTPKWYIAFKQIKNFCCVEIQYSQDKLLLYLKVDPATVDLTEDWARDVSQIGHYGTGDLELTITSMEDLEKAFPLIQQSYELA